MRPATKFAWYYCADGRAAQHQHTFFGPGFTQTWWADEPYDPRVTPTLKPPNGGSFVMTAR